MIITGESITKPSAHNYLITYDFIEVKLQCKFKIDNSSNAEFT